ncbi:MULTISPECIES: TraR/DksA family transcriptional regulator [Pseudomonas]|uniref:TraR/DksA family transcriptional regulator n=1 Tax=Pseudomonas saxonica TaxID=2600598 RepID=A0ABY3GLA9_9PSED|nr:MULTISPECIES: TraR/DksA family transcriptional regulator [Pseudomonas]MCH4873038.1 TraR/DksA family transcriptional regulator [Pseudomonas sp. TMW22091]TWR92129.1 TraR/DksA family transcriptional regulator [Pseudomonas saxonica]
MADIADFANDLVQERIDQALAARKALPVFESFEFCVDCDSTIPMARRLAVTSCTRCAACQQLNEQVGTRYAR